MLMTTVEEREIYNTGFRLSFSCVDHAVWVTVHIAFSFLICFFPATVHPFCFGNSWDRLHGQISVKAASAFLWLYFNDS